MGGGSTRRGWSERAAERIGRYQRSEKARVAAGCCRFSPSCSHYAIEAFETRRFPVAMALVLSRLVRCNPLTRRMTHDPVTRSARGPRPGLVRTGFAVLALAGFVGLLVAAAVPNRASADPVTGGCSGGGNGRSADSMTRGNPLVLKEGETFSAEGSVPAAYASGSPRSVTHVEIFIVKGLFSRKTEDHVSTGDTWSSNSVKVDDYFNRNWGLGLYRFEITNTGPGWVCRLTGYVKLEGNPLTTAIGIAGAAGTVAGAAGVAGAGFAKRRPSPLDIGFEAYDAANPPSAPPVGGQPQGPDEHREMCPICLFGWPFLPCVVMLMLPLMVMPLFGAGGGGAAGSVVWRKIVFRRGRPVLGFVSGLIFGLGVSILLWQYAVWTLSVVTIIVVPLAAAVIGTVRALFRPYRLVVRRPAGTTATS